MKKYLVLIILSLLISCKRYTFEQDTIDDESRTLCPSGSCVVTYLWDNGKFTSDEPFIIEVWYDDSQTITDSIVKVRIENCERLIKVYNSLIIKQTDHEKIY